ncbi:MAG: phosphoribosylglycinamide formyltransferase [Gammaproteobacteria bacterium]|nr:phosphoribosylglycinamide formyltransferase [Rhodocyclaceae bacterium]MBU3907615.1 phosphoribosylglycinamide formyltransferase [Gammaproteobacteria bacterium]MBU3990897.1 phosphoribosylglycinamide formyltransferase [Gammaproteobacteria bacterium]MBU4004261.1 phosphoribosylglycinamide formyltransferase [Gammaproteobacteria bacterium]MBU4019670.1 phosphoribosylglycinamide formyltransferase [Gammaproteobacteria bacterium]
MKNYVILISGRGSNMQALLDARLPGTCSAVISNRPDAAGLAWAAARGVPTAVVDHKAFASREEFDTALTAEIERRGADLVLLAGFMRVLGEAFVRRFEGRLVNIHPSLLPAFPGLHTHEAALQTGVRVHGCTVHFVTPALDCGPIIVQAVVPVLADDTADLLGARVLAQEHLVYRQAAQGILEGRCRLEAGRVIWTSDTTTGAAVLRVPAGA